MTDHRRTQYWALIEPDLGETVDRPGGIFKIEDGLIYRLDPNGDWTETPSFIKYPMKGEDGALPITTAHALDLIDRFPWEGSRAVRNQGAKVKDPDAPVTHSPPDPDAPR